MNELIIKGEKAKRASYEIGILSTLKKDEALNFMADSLIKNEEIILRANSVDIDNAVANGISKVMLDRLKLNSSRILAMANGLRQVASLPDPIGEVLSMWKRPNGLQIGKQCVPLGVVGIIYEARPNVTCDAVGLCLKSGNAVILRGGSEAINSNKAIVNILKNSLDYIGFNKECVQLVEDISRETALKMMKLNEYIDVLIPRGGASLIQSVVNNATVPVIETGVGNCHIYVDELCDFHMAEDIIINGKTSRPSVCNATEKLLVNKNIANEFIPFIVEKLNDKKVQVRGDQMVKALMDSVVEAKEEDWSTEYLDYIIGIKVVDNIDEAIAHINKYGSGHSEGIVTNSYENSQKFLQRVDAAAVYVNASTRFTDGEEFGFGAEIGISTQKLHARGPMGLKELTTTKYIIYGNGQIR